MAHRVKRADAAWIALLVSVVVYEAMAPEGELLSEGWDRYLQSSPVLARLLPLVVTLHVINALPARFDPVSRLHGLVRAL